MLYQSVFNSFFDKIRMLFAKQINILLIDDNIQICSLLCDAFFRSQILNNRTVNTFEEARNAIFSKVCYNCWILDLTLEEHNDGLKLLKNKPNFPYRVVISGSQSLSDATTAIREGAYGAYDKNIRTPDLSG
jgi:DNA-binding NtrC family response regulator